MTKKVLMTAAAIALLSAALVSGAYAKIMPEMSSDMAVATAATAAVTTGPEYTPVMIVTVRKPAQIPGHVLAPGKYNFELINSDQEVAISSADGAKFYGVYLVSSSQRSHAGEAFIETAGAPQGGPDRILAWYYPDQYDGHAFIYPQGKRGVQLAQAK
jgi:hypothetical protein